MIKAAVVGASGYSGKETLRLLLARDDVVIDHIVAGASAGKRVDELYPSFTRSTDLTFEAFDARKIEGVDVVFLALPSGEAMNIVPLLSGPRIIDLGGDFRLPSAALYEQFYGRTHHAPGLLREAVYGLPELNKTRIAGARLVANPGCYPTAAILALLPALQRGVIAATGIVVNSLSGVSGAGRSASFDMSFAEINENVRAYKVGTHQHIPEMESVLEHALGRKVSLSFVPHLVPMTRGIYSTIHANLTSQAEDLELLELYENFYDDAPFVRIRRQVPQLRDVLYTNFCDISLVVNRRTRQLVLVSVIDNLIKGAAGQAVQNMNIMFGMPEELGLLIREKHYV